MKLLLTFILTTKISFGTTFLSYNAGLAHNFVDYAKERRVHIIEALKNISSDVVCLQEVWEHKDRKAFKKALKNHYPEVYFTITKQQRSDKAPSCQKKDLFGEGKFVTCMSSLCKGLSGDEHTNCVLDKCQDSLRSLRDSKAQCAKALMAQVGKSPLSAILTILNPFKPAGLFNYGGSDGLMFFSKRPITKIEVMDFSKLSTLNRRKAIVATIDGKKIACTHLAADLEKTAPYAGEFGTWKNEHKKQLSSLLKNNDIDILMGDFNCSFKDQKNSIEGEIEDNCKLLKKSGYVSQVTKLSPECTFCSTNSLNSDEEKDVLIDHVFTRKNLPVRQTRIVLKNKVFLRKSKVMSHLSDHYGVFLRL